MWTIAWNCIVVAKSLKSWNCSKTDAQNADNEEEDWMLDLDNWVCNQLPFSHWSYPLTSLDIPSAHNFFAASINPAYNSFNGGWLINFDVTAHKINSLQDAKVSFITQVLFAHGTPIPHLEKMKLRVVIAIIASSVRSDNSLPSLKILTEIK